MVALIACTLAGSAPNSCFARSMARASTRSARSQPATKRLPGQPSTFLFAQMLPSIPAVSGDAKFSDAIRLIVARWRAASRRVRSASSGSKRPSMSAEF